MLKPKLNWNLHEDPKAKVKLKISSLYSPILFMDNSFPKNMSVFINSNTHYGIKAAFGPGQTIAVLKQ